MVYNLSINLDGQNIDFDTVCDHLGSDLVAETIVREGDKVSLPKTFWYATSDYIFIEHKNKYAISATMDEYQKAYINFLENNYKVLKKCGVKKIELRFTVYDEGTRSSFQIFSNRDMKKLINYNLNIPVDVYFIGKRKLKKWEREIERGNVGYVPEW